MSMIFSVNIYVIIYVIKMSDDEAVDIAVAVANALRIYFCTHTAIWVQPKPNCDKTPLRHKPLPYVAIFTARCSLMQSAVLP